MISSRYPQYKMPLELKKNIIADSKNDDITNTQLLRDLVKPLITDDEAWEKNTAETMMEQYPLLKSCLGRYCSNNLLY